MTPFFLGRMFSLCSALVSCLQVFGKNFQMLPSIVFFIICIGLDEILWIGVNEILCILCNSMDEKYLVGRMYSVRVLQFKFCFIYVNELFCSGCLFAGIPKSFSDVAFNCFFGLYVLVWTKFYGLV